MNDLLVKKIEGIIRGIGYGTKTPSDSGAGSLFAKLKPINEPMHDDLMDKYKEAVRKYNEKNAK